MGIPYRILDSHRALHADSIGSRDFLVMDWERLTKYECPRLDCSGRLRLSANKKMYVCNRPLCHYVIRVVRRDEIAEYYPTSINLLSVRRAIADNEIH